MTMCGRCGDGRVVIGRPSPGNGLEAVPCPICGLEPDSLPDRFKRRIQEIRPRPSQHAEKALAMIDAALKDG